LHTNDTECPTGNVHATGDAQPASRTAGRGTGGVPVRPGRTRRPRPVARRDRRRGRAVARLGQPVLRSPLAGRAVPVGGELLLPQAAARRRVPGSGAVAGRGPVRVPEGGGAVIVHSGR